MTLRDQDFPYPKHINRLGESLNSAFEDAYDGEFSYQELSGSNWYSNDNLDLFWGESDDQHFLVFLAEDQDQVDESVIKMYSQFHKKMVNDPSEDTLRKFDLFAKKLIDDPVDLDHGGVFTFDDRYEPGEALDVQYYFVPSEERVYAGANGRAKKRVREVEEDIAKDSVRNSMRDLWDKVFYDARQQIEEWNVLESENEIEDTEFNSVKTGEIPSEVNPKYYGSQGELWQVSASKTTLNSSSGFLRVWTTEDGNLIVDPTEELDEEEAVNEVKNMLNA